MFFEDVKKAVEEVGNKNNWKSLGRDRKGRFTPRGNQDETKISRPKKETLKKPVTKKKTAVKKEILKTKDQKKKEDKDTKEETKKLVKKVKSSYDKKVKHEEEKKVNPIPKKDEIGLTMNEYLKKFHK